MTARVAEIEVVPDPEGGCYPARFLSGPVREEIVALFGTNSVPLPWEHTADPEEVLRAVGELYPRAEVRPS